jgi:predicted transcriptional regulator
MTWEPLRRDSTRVIYDILTLGAQGPSKTQITFRANLSHKLIEKYTIFLVKKGLLKIESFSDGTRYLLTDRGEHLLHLLQQVERELDDFYAMSLASKMKARSPGSQNFPIFEYERRRVPPEIQRALTS